MTVERFKAEKNVWAAFRDLLPAGMMVRRIEDASGNLGTWDTFLAAGARSNWIEIKHAGPNAKPRLQPGQRAFGLDLFDAGFRSGYLVGSPDGSVRLIGQITNGDDWRDYLIFRREALDSKAVALVLNHLGLDGK